jgi:hypothetical protein
LTVTPVRLSVRFISTPPDPVEFCAAIRNLHPRIRISLGLH